MYTWGYLKENVLTKLNLTEDEANQQGFLSAFPYYANEAMTQICSSIKPNEKYFLVDIDKNNINKSITMPEDFISFSDDIARYKDIPACIGGIPVTEPEYREADDRDFEYRGYNEIICFKIGTYLVPYNARWFFFTKDLDNFVKITAPVDVLEAIPSYIVSQCYKVDDETKSAIFRNEYEMFLARIDDTSFKMQRSLTISGGW